ncbi:hypothetical protein [Serratia sp. UGAL515B_01]|uniref:hypothetical protein n=1 Tax=Serratia sp. UGAL515B_01 TaxID=2986763 RepID=UPI00295321F0|nr:hypothetical protein [Serratia sp. UGAL515B_01]WON75547.1 hypothetical protein OK023_00080 [Serratia sp. UGAL515B_01]
MKNLTENAKKFLAKKPLLIGVVMGYKFYEHPELGDETDLKVLTLDGRLVSSGYYDLPSTHEMMGISF